MHDNHRPALTPTRLPRLMGGALLSGTIALLTACGPSADEVAESQAKIEASKSAKAEASASASASAAAASASAKAEAEQAAVEAERSACADATSKLLDTLEQINSRLNVGLTYDAFGDRLGDASVAYDQINFKKLDDKCTLNIGIALEDAYNEYAKSLGTWGDCIDDYYCSVDGKVLAGMRKHWSEAGERIDFAHKVLGSTNSYKKANDLGLATRS